MEVFNIIEQEVFYEIDQVLKDMDNVCKCNKCKLDIAAIALNNLKPKYVVTQEGYAFTKANNFNMQFTADLIAAVTKAVEIVSNNPRHNS